MINTTDTISAQRDALRKQLRRRRKALSTQQLDRAACDLTAQLLATQLIANQRNIAAYLPVAGEIDPLPTLQFCRDRGLKTFLPVIHENVLLFGAYDEHTRLVSGQYDIPVPDCGISQMLQPHQLDLVLVPLLGFDAHCNRLGMGGGYYDRSFAFRQQHGREILSPVLCAVAHECQKVNAIPTEPWDVRMDMVVTDHSVYHRSNAST